MLGRLLDPHAACLELRKSLGGNPITEVPFPREISGGQRRASLLPRPSA
jgi:hypothetical protein